MPAAKCKITLDGTAFLIRFYVNEEFTDIWEAEEITVDRATLSYLVTKDVLEDL
jgi:hypothetical protein